VTGACVDARTTAGLETGATFWWLRYDVIRISLATGYPKSRFPAGMTDRRTGTKATAKAKAEVSGWLADLLVGFVARPRGRLGGIRFFRLDGGGRFWGSGG
jgi:hypothetical protein